MVSEFHGGKVIESKRQSFLLLLLEIERILLNSFRFFLLGDLLLLLLESTLSVLKELLCLVLLVGVVGWKLFLVLFVLSNFMES